MLKIRLKYYREMLRIKVKLCRGLFALWLIRMANRISPHAVEAFAVQVRREMYFRDNF